MNDDMRYALEAAILFTLAFALALLVIMGL